MKAERKYLRPRANPIKKPPGAAAGGKSRPKPESKTDPAKPLAGKKRWTEEDFEILNEIGKGRYGVVSRARELRSGKVVALKKVTAQTLTETESFDLIRNEIELNSRLLCANIVRMYGFFPTKDCIVMVLEFVEGGDLFTRLAQAGGYIGEPEAAFILSQLVDALMYLRERHVIHRDIKPENLLLTRDSKGRIGQVKLCDFTWAAHCLEDERRATVCGTPAYLAPEVASAIDYDGKVDIWSTGVLLYQMLTGTLIVVGNDLTEIKEAMLKMKVNFPEKPKISGGAKELVQKLLARLPEDRPTLEEIKQNCWVILNRENYKSTLVT